jgi:hypothetical protein
MRVDRARHAAALMTAAILASCSATPPGGSSTVALPSASAPDGRATPQSLPRELQGVAWWRTQHPIVQDVGDVGNLAVGTLATGVTATIAGEPGPGGWQPIFTDAAAGSIAYGTTTRGRGEIHLVDAQSGTDRLLATLSARPVAGILSADGHAVLSVLVNETGDADVWRVPAHGRPQLLAPISRSSASGVPLDASRVSVVNDRSVSDSAMAVLTCEISCAMWRFRLLPDGMLRAPPEVQEPIGLTGGDRLLGLNADWLLTTSGLWSWSANRLIETIDVRDRSAQLIPDRQGAPLVVESTDDGALVRQPAERVPLSIVPGVTPLDHRLAGAGADLPDSWFLGLELADHGARAVVAVRVDDGTVVQLDALGTY